MWEKLDGAVNEQKGEGDWSGFRTRRTPRVPRYRPGLRPRHYSSIRVIRCAVATASSAVGRGCGHAM